jgi:Leucine-rich repeat (LRR) protein
VQLNITPSHPTLDVQVVLDLPRLTILMASYNKISSIPEIIGACSRLQAIVVQSNCITVRVV